MNIINPEKLEHWYSLNFEENLKGRRILFDDIQPLIRHLDTKFEKELLGYSERNIPIFKISFGSGKRKILMWSQMHGNESTGTKALFDLFKFFDADDDSLRPVVASLLDNCTISCIVMLNPDGAIEFTRENANGIDLNRDAIDRKAEESRLLRSTLDSFNPEFCFNLHDQRNIFNVENTEKPATISFLAPSEDEVRTLTSGRKKTMSVIVAMNMLLQQVIPNQIGRYTDEFYPTATGDNFQKLGHNTILIEAGHYKDDYAREVTRKFNFFALLQGLYFIATAKDFKNFKPYFDIPNNDEMFLDVIYHNIKIIEENSTRIVDVGVQRKYKVVDNELISYEHIEKIGNLSNYYTFNYINAENLNFKELKLSNS
jgi:hypothetical protein